MYAVAVTPEHAALAAALPYAKMSARVWLNLGLVILLAGLALVAWFKPGQPLPAEIQLTALYVDAIDNIRIQSAEQPTIKFERHNGQWRLTSPMDAPANEVRIGALLNLAAMTSDTHYNAARLDLAKYGLARPNISVTLNHQRLTFGDVNPVDYRRYVRVGDTVYLITDDLLDLETADAASYVTPKLIPSGSEISALALPGVKLERAADGRWKSSSNTLSQAKVDALLEAWNEAQAYQVMAYEKTGDRAHSKQILIKLADGERLTFNVIARKPELILARPQLGIEYHLPADVAKSLLYPEARAAKKSAP